MNKEYELLEEFKKIAAKRWIEGVNNSTGSIGMTFERALGKKPDKFYFPDYYGTELKCTSRFSGYPYTLFSCSFDGPTYPEIYRIVNKFGEKDKLFPDKKVLYTRLKFNSLNLVNDKYYFKLDINEEEDKIFLKVYDLNNNLIDDKSFVYISTVKNHLMLKLKKLAIVHASKKQCNNKYYFRYYKIGIYNIKEFAIFLEMLKKDLINVQLVSRTNKSGKKIGEYANKNLVFSIDKNKLEILFDKIIEYNYDSETRNNFFIMP